MEAAGDELRSKFAAVLPKDSHFVYYHISTEPTAATPLFSPPPQGQPQKTYCESHSLLFTLLKDGKQKVAFFAIEVLIYTTASLTTLFVSKADSTGFTHLLNVARSFPSVVRSVTAAFVSHLIRHRHRPDRKLVISLFARAQSAYLFPGSDENKNKHVLDDRNLVKWWCRTLDPVLREYKAETLDQPSDKVSSKAYLIVPGHDKYETTAFFPPSSRQDGATQKRWTYGHPLRDIAPVPTAPPRCLVPHFPDDPKARFLIDLDEELNDVPASQQQPSESPSKRGRGQWKSVKSLEQFWELMAFRQECSSGRLVGFLWIVFSPPHSDLDDAVDSKPPPSPSLRPVIPLKPSSNSKDSSSPAKPKRKKRLTGPIVPRSPRVKSSQVKRAFAETTKHWHAPHSSRGSLVISQKAYERIHEIMLRLDFADLDAALGSTTRWIREAGIIGGAASGADWGVAVVGQRSVDVQAGDRPKGTPAAPNVLLGKRKKAAGDQVAVNGASGGTTNGTADGGAKKLETTEPEARAGAEAAPAVNSLGASLIRKKPKT